MDFEGNGKRGQGGGGGACVEEKEGQSKVKEVAVFEMFEKMEVEVITTPTRQVDLRRVGNGKGGGVEWRA